MVPREAVDGGRDFEAFFDRTFSRAVGVAVRMGLGGHDAEDVVLDAMAVAYDRWSRVSDLEHRDAWFYKVVVHRALRLLKRAARTVPSNDLESEGVEHDLAGAMSIRAGIAALPQRQRQVVAMRYLADLSVEEVARTLHMSSGTVKQHAARGRASLREWIEHSELGASHDR